MYTCQNGLLTTLFLRCFVYPVSVHSGYTLIGHTVRHWTTVVGLVPRRAGVVRQWGLVGTAATGCRTHAGCCGLRCPVHRRVLGCWVGTRSGGLGWAVACTGFGVAGCRCTGLVRLARRVLPPGYSPGYRVQAQGYRLVGCTCWSSRF